MSEEDQTTLPGTPQPILFEGVRVTDLRMKLTAASNLACRKGDKPVELTPGTEVTLIVTGHVAGVDFDFDIEKRLQTRCHVIQVDGATLAETN